MCVGIYQDFLLRNEAVYHATDLAGHRVQFLLCLDVLLDLLQEGLHQLGLLYAVSFTLLLLLLLNEIDEAARDVLIFIVSKHDFAFLRQPFMFNILTKQSRKEKISFSVSNCVEFTIDSALCFSFFSCSRFRCTIFSPSWISNTSMSSFAMLIMLLRSRRVASSTSGGSMVSLA